MKLTLILVMCSGIHTVCLPPLDTQLIFNDWHSCALKGYEESLELMKGSEAEHINEGKLFVKFYCLEKIIEEDT